MQMPAGAGGGAIMATMPQSMETTMSTLNTHQMISRRRSAPFLLYTTTTSPYPSSFSSAPAQRVGNGSGLRLGRSFSPCLRRLLGGFLLDLNPTLGQPLFGHLTVRVQL